MSTPHVTPPRGHQDASLREEQAFCRGAIDSGAYDSMSDRDWVALCEDIAAKSRNITEDGDGKAFSTEKRTLRSRKRPTDPASAKTLPHM